MAGVIVAYGWADPYRSEPMADNILIGGFTLIFLAAWAAVLAGAKPREVSK